MEEGTVDLRGIRDSFAKFVENGTLDQRVVTALVVDNKFVSKECELWDYKREAGKDNISLAETVLQIVSFYNTFGGYLLYGVEEINTDIEFACCGISKNNVNLQQLKQNVTNYTGEQIDISYKEFEYKINDIDYSLGIIHIPKRPEIKPPIFFGKDGPQKKNGNPVFKKDISYLRILDQCLPATKKEDFQMLFGKRENPYLWESRLSLGLVDKSITIEHNLPDRAFVCSKFFGRESEINELWRWLGDELSNTKMLAGEGGKGKTSIAYEFAEEICKNKPSRIEKVIWLTAKTQQFVAEFDTYVNVPHTDFYDLESLLKAICTELAILDSEMEGASIPLLKKYVKKGLETLPSLVIVDNVDSIDENQQKLIFETAMQFPGSGTRFLLTTRTNKIFSGNQCITIGGLDKDNYYKFVMDITSRFKCAQLSANQIDDIRKVTDGSPLFTESLLRLQKTGMPLKQAIKEWKGKEGSEVRKAALQVEINHLTSDSKMVLLAASYMGEVSFTELKQVTGFDNSRMQKCINELNSFFLIEAKPIIKREARFTISENTSRLVSELEDKLVMNPSALKERITKLRKRRIPDEHNRSYVSAVGAAINQSNAMLREKNSKGAIATLEASLANNKNNPDLLCQLAVCQFEEYQNIQDPQQLEISMNTFKRSYQSGQRREILFTGWYDAVISAKDPSSAIEVATYALDLKNQNKIEWFKKRAMAYVILSQSLEKALNIDLSIDNMKKAASDIGKALEEADYLQKPPFKEILGQFNDDLWELCRKNLSPSITEYKDLFDTARFFIKIGDDRSLNYERLIQTIIDSINFLIRAGKATSGQINLIQNLAVQCNLESNKLKSARQEGEIKNIRDRIKVMNTNLNDFINKYRPIS